MAPDEARKRESKHVETNQQLRITEPYGGHTKGVDLKQ
jgi:hypothetical protein